MRRFFDLKLTPVELVELARGLGLGTRPLTDAEVGILVRNVVGCRFEEIKRQGRKGLRVDALIASGELEVGRP